MKFFIISRGFKKTFPLLLFVALSTPAHALEISKNILTTLEQAYPGAEIVDVEKEKWQGQEVTEIELVAADGIRYELLFSDDGRILKSEEEEELPLIGGEVAIGIGGRVESEIYRGVDTEFGIVPFLRYENGPLVIEAYDELGVTYTVLGGDGYKVGVKGAVDFGAGYDPDDSDYFRGMDELDTLYNLGVEFEWVFADWIVGMEFSQDVSGEHDGQEIELTLGRSWDFGGFELQPSFSMAWLSEEAVDYFYGVSQREARADRPAYSPGSSVELAVELMVTKRIIGDLQVVGIVEVAAYGDEITDSPLVDEDYSYETILGLIYTF
ncbi:MAG: MipA/OmpV family protein [Desulfopila sp.]|jgi:outer membrane protein|nr:MipA/OmpV family protein [Desulfopila sp.]